MGDTSRATGISPGLVSDKSPGAGGSDVNRGLAFFGMVRRFRQGLERFAFRRRQNEPRIALVLHPAYSPYTVAEFALTLVMALNRRIHPRMPKKAVVVRTMSALGTADVCYGNEPMRRQLLNKPRHVPASAMEFFRQQPE